jgi:hypothetical protein
MRKTYGREDGSRRSGADSETAMEISLSGKATKIAERIFTRPLATSTYKFKI